MDPAYKKLLQRRKQLIMEDLKWTPEFSRELAKEGIIPRQVLQDMEMDSNQENRTFVLLAKLPVQSGADLFGRFCGVLERAGQGELAAVLKDDQEAITWDFTASVRLRSVSRYMEVLENMLLQRLQREQDPLVRRKLIPVITEWVHNLSHYIREHEVSYSKLKKTVMEVAGTTRQLATETQHDAVDLQQDKGFATLLLLEQEDATLVCAQLQQLLEEQRREQQALAARLQQEQQDKQKLVAQLEEVRKPSPAEAKVATLEKMLMHQDSKIMQLETQAASTDDSLKIPPFEFEQALKQLRPFVKKPTEKVVTGGKADKANKSPSPTSAMSPMDELREAVAATVDTIDRMRKRMQQTGEHIGSLETEKKTALSILGCTQKGANLPTVVQSSLTDLRDVNLQLKREVDEGQQRLQDATAEKSRLQADRDDLVQQREYLLAQLEDLKRQLEAAKSVKPAQRRPIAPKITPGVGRPHRPPERQTAVPTKISIGGSVFGSSTPSSVSSPSPALPGLTNGYLNNGRSDNGRPASARHSTPELSSRK